MANSWLDDLPDATPSASASGSGSSGWLESLPDAPQAQGETKSTAPQPGAPDESVRTFDVGPGGELTPKRAWSGYTGSPTMFPGFQMGLADAPVAAAQVGAHALYPVAPSLGKRMDSFVDQREAEYQANQPPPAPGKPWESGVFNQDAPGGPVYVPKTTPTGAEYGSNKLDAGRALGNVLMTAPVGALMPGASAAGLMPRIASGAAAGGATAALNPVSDTDSEADFWGKKGEQALTGAATGGATTAGLATTARLIQGQSDPRVAMLMSKGVRPTPGQILGGSANRMEEALTSVPLVGDAIKNARAGAVQEFNRAAINDALGEVGQSLNKGTQLGRAAIDEAASKISDAYNAVLPKLKPQADVTFLDNMSNLKAMARSMPPDRAQQFEGLLQNTIFSRMSKGGGMTGEGFKEADSQLGSLARKYRNAPDPDVRQLGDGLLQAQSELRGMVSRSNPALAPVLDANNRAYAAFLRVQTAAARQGAEEGVFTPAQLSSAVRELDPTLRHSGFARGNALMQDLSDAGKSILGSKVPDSGTPLRGAAMAAPAIYGAYLANPAAGTALAAGGAGMLGAYSPLGRAAIAHLLASRPDFAGPLAQSIRGASPAAAAANAALFSRLVGQ